LLELGLSGFAVVVAIVGAELAVGLSGTPALRVEEAAGDADATMEAALVGLDVVELVLEGEPLALGLGIGVIDRTARRMRLFRVSAISRDPSSGCTPIPEGPKSAMAFTGPASPLNSPTPVPNAVTMVPLGNTRRMRLLSKSTMNTERSAGCTATPHG
jgi:hypothetical protein